MSAPSLPSSALWEVIHSLTRKEVRALYAEIKGTRLGWLFKTLRQMAIYSDEALQQAFQATLPNTDSGTLRTYKKQLWFLLEKHLPPYRGSAQRGNPRLAPLMAKRRTLAARPHPPFPHPLAPSHRKSHTDGLV